MDSGAGKTMFEFQLWYLLALSSWEGYLNPISFLTCEMEILGVFSSYYWYKQQKIEPIVACVKCFYDYYIYFPHIIKGY